MATMTISLPDPMKDWIETRVREGHYGSASDYLRDLVRRDREKTALPQLTLEDLQRLLEEAGASGVGKKSLNEIFEEAVQITKERGTYRE